MVDFVTFDDLHDEGKDLIRHWFTRAKEERDYFTRFVFIWMAFNGWMSCVTEETRDHDMINALCKDGTLRREFRALMAKDAKDAKFREKVLLFSERWPIHVAVGRRRQPERWVQNNSQSPKWDDLLQAIYQVRCNLFHGNKATYVERDSKLVELSFECLRRFIEN